MGGYPILRNFSKQIYNADTQNWDIAQYPDGKIAFANKRGLLIFDGSRWNLFPLNNYGAARSLLIDSTGGRTYVGGSWTFGFFEPSDSTGNYKFHSLVESIKGNHSHIGDVWNIMKIDQDIYFQSDYDLFKYNGKETIPYHIGEKILASHLIDGRIYFALRNGKFCRFENGKISELISEDNYPGNTVAAITDHPLIPGQGIIVTQFSGCYSFDPVNIRKYPTDIDQFLKESQVFCATTNGPEVAFGTVNNGAVIKNFQNNTLSFISKESGMQNNTVLSAFFDRNKNIWLGLDNGIDFVGHNSPIKLLLPQGLSFGTGYASFLQDNTLYYGTNQGLYTIKYPIDLAKAVNPERVLHGQVWSIDFNKVNNEIIVSSDLGLFVVKQGNIDEIGSLGGVWNVIFLSDNKMIVSTYDNYHILKKTSSGWIDEGKIEGFNETNGKIDIDQSGKIWIADWQKGLYSMNLDINGRKFINVKHYSREDGLPSNQNIGLEIIDGEAVISSSAGFYRFNPKTRRMEYNKELNLKLPFYASAHLYKSNNGSLWGVNGKKIIVSSVSASGLATSIDSTTFSITARKMVPGFDNLNFIGEKVIAGFEDGFYEFDSSFSNLMENEPKVGLSKIILNNDSVISGDIPSAKKGELVLPYNLSSVRFEAFLPEYRYEGAVTYSFYLEGYDKGWSSFSGADSKEYTRLGYGKYLLHIKTYNDLTGIISECEFRFLVATPWYWSIAAKIVYTLILLILIGMSARMILKYSQNKAKKVEAKKEEEISLLRQAADESERENRNRIETLQKENKEDKISHLSESLANVTRNTMHRNEILLRIHNRLDDIKNSIKPENQSGVILNKQVGDVQQLINDTLQRDDTLTQVDRNFEGLYGDYVERLKEAFPDLTKMEFRLCCFIKMGLSTKEIAPLMNVAPKSVEMSRYRLRKKMQLERDVNLSKFLQDF